MVLRLLVLLLIFASCNSNETLESTETKTDTSAPTTIVPDTSYSPPTTVDTQKVYANARFKDVKVLKTGDQTFQITGKGQIFEASFNWVIEDGHDELKSGFTMTDAGAPEWGNFSFTVDAPKKRANSTLHIILYEASAKDGSRQHELPVLLY
jgi:hypothetical protein